MHTRSPRPGKTSSGEILERVRRGGRQGYRNRPIERRCRFGVLSREKEKAKKARGRIRECPSLSMVRVMVIQRI